jgi:hypothetical protein
MRRSRLMGVTGCQTRGSGARSHRRVGRFAGPTRAQRPRARQGTRDLDRPRPDLLLIAPVASPRPGHGAGRKAACIGSEPSAEGAVAARAVARLCGWIIGSGPGNQGRRDPGSLTKIDDVSAKETSSARPKAASPHRIGRGGLRLSPSQARRQLGAQGRRDRSGRVSGSPGRPGTPRPPCPRLRLGGGRGARAPEIVRG